MSYCQTVDDHYFEICRNIDVRDARKTLGSDMAPTKRDVASHCVWALEATNDPLGVIKHGRGNGDMMTVSWK